MAEGFANRYGSDVLIATSAGLAPTKGVAPETVETMHELGIDVSGHIPARYEPVLVPRYDLVVNMSGYRLPGDAPQELIEWDVEDPYLGPPELYRRVRADLENRVMQLILLLRRRKKLSETPAAERTP
jgi:protein-tyrosine-phosphatase